MRLFPVIMLLCVICATASANHHLTTSRKLAYYSRYAKAHLATAFKRAGVTYPAKRIALLVFKQSRQLQLYASQGGAWHFIKSFPIKAASGGPGPKLHEGDHQVPEGIYRIMALNPDSHYLMSMKLNYPNAFDRQKAQIMHRYHLGGNIFIHGKASSVGCLAIGDRGIKQLFPLVAAVGVDHVSVIIAPSDLRYKKPTYGPIHPKWLPALYTKIRWALSNFPLPSHSGSDRMVR